MVTVSDLQVVVREGSERRAVLDGVTCVFPAGRLTVINGPSGSGKTTLLSAIGCLLTPTRGSVTLDGQEVSRLGDRQRTELRRSRIGFVFQSHRLLPQLSVFENVAVALRLERASKRDRRRLVTSALEDVKLDSFASSRIGALSGGERQRVAIARALVKRPSVILADEPTASLDGHNARAIVAILQGLTRSHGCTVIVVTHDQRLLEFADKTITLEDGTVTNAQEPR